MLNQDALELIPVGTEFEPGVKKQKVDAEGNVYTWEPSANSDHDGQWVLTGHIDLPGLEEKYGKGNLPKDLTNEVQTNLQILMQANSLPHR